MKHEPDFYRIEGENVYDEYGKCMANLNDPNQYEDGWWVVLQSQCCAVSRAAIDETMGDFGGDFETYGPYADLDEAQRNVPNHCPS